MNESAMYSDAAMRLLDTEKWCQKSRWFKEEVDEFNREVQQLVKEASDEQPHR